MLILTKQFGQRKDIVDGKEVITNPSYSKMTRELGWECFGFRCKTSPIEAQKNRREKKKFLFCIPNSLNLFLPSLNICLSTPTRQRTDTKIMSNRKVLFLSSIYSQTLFSMLKECGRVHYDCEYYIFLADVADYVVNSGFGSTVALDT